MTQTWEQELQADYHKYIYPYLGAFFVAAAASYLLTDSLIRAIPFSTLDGKSKLAIVNGFYAAASIPIAKTFWMRSASWSKT